VLSHLIYYEVGLLEIQVSTLIWKATEIKSKPFQFWFSSINLVFKPLQFFFPVRFFSLHYCENNKHKRFYVKNLMELSSSYSSHFNLMIKQTKSNNQTTPGRNTVHGLSQTAYLTTLPVSLWVSNLLIW
jgi:hypothetical protein